MVPIYFDHNASTPLDARALSAMLPYLQGSGGNPSSVHRFGRLLRGAIEHARNQVARLVNADPSQVIFTSGGSEANNLAIKGALQNVAKGKILVSAIEHDSTLQSAYALQKQGWQVDTISVDENGVINLEDFRNQLTPETRLVSVMMANNESGTLQNIAAIAELARSRGVLFHSDAVQAAGKLAIDFAASGAQMLSLSSHKIYGPQGVGALVLDRSLDLVPLIDGGGQESGLRSGTENVAAIVGFGAAAELARAELAVRQAHMSSLRDELESGLAKLQGVTLLANTVSRLSNTSLFSVASIDGEALLMNLDRAGFAVSSGSACASGTGQPSHVLQAMHVPAALAECVIRVSVGYNNTFKEIENFLTALQEQIRYWNEARLS